VSHDLPWFPLYVSDFLGDETVKIAPNRALGVYFKLLCHQWTHKSIPGDPATLAKIVGESQAAFEALWVHIHHRFRKRGDRLVNPKLEAVRRQQLARQHKLNLRATKAGLASARSRLQVNQSESESDIESKTETTESKALVHLHVEGVEAATQRRHTVEAALHLAVETAFAYWQARLGHPGAILDRKRASRIEARLRENGGDVSELLYAVDGALRDDWLMGRDAKSHRRYDGIETVFRDREQVERLVASVPGRNGQHPFLSQPVPA
jgi:uncharacterized protein YdaU (DUF1376 family)